MIYDVPPIYEHAIYTATYHPTRAGPPSRVAWHILPPGLSTSLAVHGVFHQGCIRLGLSATSRLMGLPEHFLLGLSQANQANWLLGSTGLQDIGIQRGPSFMGYSEA
jgi:hypothetical protein